MPEEFLAELRSRTPMRPLVARQVTLTVAGRNWKGCCPFHNERSPSFYVYEDGYHCFGCGAHGDAIEFVAKMRGLSTPEAVAVLAQEAGLALPQQGSAGLRLPALMGAVPAGTPAGGRKVLANESKMPDAQVDAVLATAARLLVRQNQVTAASILANAAGRLSHLSYDNWNGGQDTWRLALAIPAEVYFDLQDREEREREITTALNTAMEAVSSSDFVEAKIITGLDDDPDWRRRVNQHLSGEGITNQGRVRSDNVAAIEQDGLLFRSRPEVRFYEALKRAGVAFAPLSVVLHGSLGTRGRRVEPDFIIYKDGMVMVVEIDGDLYHSETPSAAHARLKFLTDEGAKLERINASACDTPEKAKEAVERVLATLEKLRRGRP